MGNACASCGEDDDLLFACQHCEREFCSAHQFPAHDCTHDGATDEEGPTDAGFDGSGWVPAAAVEGAKPEPDRVESPADVAAILGTGAETETPSGPTAPSAAAEKAEQARRRERGRVSARGMAPAATDDTEPESGPSRTDPAEETEPAAAPVEEAVAAGEDGRGASEGTAARRSPATLGTGRSVGVVEATGEPSTIGEWLDRQSYVSFLVKTAIIALLVNGAFYGGVALTLYDLVGLSL